MNLSSVIHNPSHLIFAIDQTSSPPLFKQLFKWVLSLVGSVLACIHIRVCMYARTSTYVGMTIWRRTCIHRSYWFMYTDIHVYVRACAHICTQTWRQCVEMHTHTNTCTYRQIHIHTRTGTYQHIHTYIHAHIHTYIHTCILTHTCIHTEVHTYIHTYIHTEKHAYIHTYIHTYMHTYTYVHTYIRTCTHIHTHTHTHAYTHTYIHTHIHTRTHSYIHTHIHAYTCTDEGEETQHRVLSRRRGLKSERFLTGVFPPMLAPLRAFQRTESTLSSWRRTRCLFQVNTFSQGGPLANPT